MSSTSSGIIDVLGIMEEEEEDKCIICQESFNESNQQIYEIPDCKCKYHTNCIVTWFRCGSNKCPLCGNRGVNNRADCDKSHYFWRGSRWRMKGDEHLIRLLRNFSKKENSPKILKQAFEKLSQCKNDYEEAKQEYREFQTLLKQSNTLDSNFFETKDKLKKLRRKRWNKEVLIGKQKKYITMLPIYPIIIPTTVDMT